MMLLHLKNSFPRRDAYADAGALRDDARRRTAEAVSTARARLPRSALAEGGWHGLALIGGYGLMRMAWSPEAALQWLGISTAVALFVHYRLWRHLATRPPSETVRPGGPLGAANRLTLARGLLVSFIAGFAALPEPLGTDASNWRAWIPGGLYLLAAVLDAVDGHVARRMGCVTALGRKLDTEMDALGLMVASILAIQLERLPVAYLAVGIAYYAYRLALWLRRRHGRPVYQTPPRTFARTIAGLQMGFVGVALLPLFEAQTLRIAGFYFMMPLLLGFVWDWLVVSGLSRAQTVRRMSRRARQIADGLPFVPRFVLFWVTYPVSLELSAGGWPGVTAAWWALAVMMVAGWLGRLAALLACLLLAGTLTVTAAAPALMAGYSSAILILLFGSGPWSLWRPEEKFLNPPPAHTDA